MKEQIQAPQGGNSDKTEEKGSAPKSLSKPMLPKGLENVHVKGLKPIGFRCSCGATRPKYGGCTIIPIYEGEGWSGEGHSYDGNRYISDEEYKQYRNNPDPTWPVNDLYK